MRSWVRRFGPYAAPELIGLPNRPAEAIAFVSGQPADEIEVEVHAQLAPDLAAELAAAEKRADEPRVMAGRLTVVKRGKPFADVNWGFSGPAIIVSSAVI